MGHRSLLVILGWMVSLQSLLPVYAQIQPNQIPDGTDGLVLEVRDSTAMQISKLPPNEFEGSYSTFKIGLGLIYDLTTYSQTDEFRSQMDSLGFSLGPVSNLRDFRILGSGRLKTQRAISWKFAYMWDGDNKTWLVRESGVTIGVPELAGHIFVGRTKEGFSMVKVMNGHSPWTSERQMAVDLIPIIADGVKWFGFLPKSRVFWNIGYYNDILSKGQKFSTFSSQIVGRLGWMPFYDPKKQRLMHVAANLRYGRPLDGKITLKSRPESNNTPQILNTGEFNTTWSTHTGAEVYYSNRKFMIGSEIVFHKFHSSESGNHRFYGGDIVVSYFFTGAVRPYNTVGSIYGFIPVKNSIFKGGLGELEGVLRFSTFNLNDGTVQGGKFWKITPMVNWYMSKIVRVEFIYGYGVLDRLGLQGGVHFFESRIQFTVM